MARHDNQDLARIRREREAADAHREAMRPIVEARQAAAPPPPAAAADRASGVTGFGPAADVQQLAGQIETWVDASGLSIMDVEIAYSFARTFASPTPLKMYEAHTALVSWARPEQESTM